MMSFVPEFRDILRDQEPLAGYTSYGLGGPAKWMACPRTIDQVARLVGYCRGEGIPLYVLGLGANVLVSDEGVAGLVVRLNAPGFRHVDWPRPGNANGNGRRRQATKGDKVTIVAGGGADMHRLVLEAVRRGLAGVEGLAGIPGTLGGIVRMNAGGQWGQIADVVREVTVVDERGAMRHLPASEVGFSYRNTRLGDAVVCQAKLELRPGDPVVLRDRFMAIWEQKKRSQPLSEASAGCVYKNPPGHRAGELIDRAGLKGKAIGGARISQLHANFIVTQEGATAEDVFSLIGETRRAVADRFGVELELEIKVWGRQRARSLEPAC